MAYFPVKHVIIYVMLLYYISTYQTFTHLLQYVKHNHAHMPTTLYVMGKGGGTKKKHCHAVIGKYIYLKCSNMLQPLLQDTFIIQCCITVSNPLFPSFLFFFLSLYPHDSALGHLGKSLSLNLNLCSVIAAEFLLCD